jgi:beta-fructofuranosidase
MEWTRERRYTKMEGVSLEELQLLKNKVDASPWRQSFHIQPETGLLNDPNGISYFNGEYHLFYQWFPLGPVHGLKYWYHTKSKDLVHWENVGVGISPGDYFDSHGAYSGSAIEHNEKLYLMYTGNTRDEKWVRYPYQCLAVMGKDGAISKIKPAIEEVPEGYTDHFRDPKVWKEGDRFWAVIGTQRTEETGCVVLYSSADLANWQFEGELKTNLDSFGYMWECPDYFEQDGQGVLIFSPQGLEPQGDSYQNIYQSGYLLGKPLNMEEKQFEHEEFCELDRGFDFYAPQTMQGPSGRRILVGWMGLPEIEYPTDVHGWAHCLTIPRELTVQGNKLIQQPVKELAALRMKEEKAAGILVDELKMFDGFNGVTYEMICEFENLDASEFGIEIRTGEKDRTVISYDAMAKKVVVDRSHSGEAFAEKYGSIRKCKVEADKIKFHLFVDVSSVELFVNDGEEVFTSRIFPGEGSEGIRFFAKEGSARFEAVKWDYQAKMAKGSEANGHAVFNR